MTPGVPVPGDIVHVGRAASVQFDGDRCLVFSVTAVDHVDAYTGWAWLTGYELGPSGAARTRRNVYVHLPGLHVLHPGRPAPPPPRPPNAIPRQFTPPRTNSRLTGR